MSAVLSPERLTELVAEHQERLDAVEDRLRLLEEGRSVKPITTKPKALRPPRHLTTIAPQPTLPSEPVPIHSALPPLPLGPPALSPAPPSFLTEIESRNEEPVRQPVPTPTLEPPPFTEGLAHPFLVEEPPTPAQPRESWEMLLATRVLPWMGGLLVIVGAVIGGSLVLPRLTPPLRTGAGFALALFILAAGFLARKRHRVIARSVMAVGAALLYFVSFAGGYMAAMKTYPQAVSLVLMGVCASGFVAVARRWRMESVAVLGYALAMVATLLSAKELGNFALLPLLILTAAAGWMLVSQEWRTLTALALLASYVGAGALWFLIPIGNSQSEILVHLASLFASSAIFLAAFWRWGRSWVAREELALTAPEEHAVPRIDVGLLPYSTAFSMLNSLGLIAASLILLNLTGTLWPQVQWLLFGLALYEGARLLAPSLSRGGLRDFHTLTLFALTAAGLSAALGGLAETASLAALALIMAYIGAQKRELRWLRPLALLPALWGMFAIRFTPPIPLAEFALALLPVALLLAGALPWGEISRRARDIKAPLWDSLEWFSAPVRALLGVILALIASAVFVDLAADWAIATFAFATALMLAVPLLRARAWALGAVAAGASALAMFSFGAPGVAWVPDAAIPWPASLLLLLAYMAAWHSAIQSSDSKVLISGLGVLGVFYSIGVATWSTVSVDSDSGWTGLEYGAMMAAFVAVWWMLRQVPPLPCLVGKREADSPSPAHNTSNLSPLLWSGVVVGALGLLSATFQDARHNLVPVGVYAALLLAGWYAATVRAERHRWLEGSLMALLLVCLSAALLIYSDFGVGSANILILVAVLAVLGGLLRRSSVTVLIGAALLMLQPLLAVTALMQDKSDAPMALAGALVLLAVAQGLRFAANRASVQDSDTEGMNGLRLFMLLGTCLLALMALSTGAFVPSSLITVSWGALAVLLLLLGFALRDGQARGLGLGVLGLAIGRTFLADLAGADALTRTLAFLGVGVLTLGAALTYAFLKRRVQAAAPPPPPADVAPEDRQEP